MDSLNSKISDARRASGLTLEQAAAACCISRPTYQLREKRESDFHLGELVKLKSAMNESGRKLLRDHIYALFF